VHAGLAEVRGSCWRYCRKIIGYVQVLLTVSVVFHVYLFQYAVNVLMTFGMTYVVLVLSVFSSCSRDIDSTDN